MTKEEKVLDQRTKFETPFKELIKKEPIAFSKWDGQFYWNNLLTLTFPKVDNVTRLFKDANNIKVLKLLKHRFKNGTL
jgi:hypothetical protein